MRGQLSMKQRFLGTKKNAMLEIEDASEIVSVYVNNQLIDTRIGQPYRFELGEMLVESENQLKIEVTNNLGRQMRDYLSQFILMEPLGILGDVQLKYNME